MTCQQCGRAPEDEADALGWGLEVDRDRVTRICPSCARVNARSIEAKLDPAFWS